MSQFKTVGIGSGLDMKDRMVVEYRKYGMETAGGSNSEMKIQVDRL